MATIAALTEDFAGGAPGATITSANTIFNNIDTSLGAVPGTFNGDSYTGALQSMNVSTSTETSSHRVDHTSVGGWFGFGLKIITTPATNTAIVNWFSGATKGGDVRILPDRTLQIRDVSAAVYTSPALADSTWYYVTVKRVPNSATGHRMKIYQAGSLLHDSGDQTASAVVAGYDNLRVGSIGSSTAQLRFARIRGDDAAEPGVGITPATAVATYTQRSLVEVDTAGSTGTMTLTQTAGPTATITGPTGGVFEVVPPSGHTDVLTFDLLASQGGATDTKVVTIAPAVGASAGATQPLVFDGVSWSTTGDPFDGWDPASTTAPPERTARAFHHNTGLFSQDMRDALTQSAVSADLTTTSDGQVFDQLDFINDVIVQHSGVVFKRCRFRKGIDVGGLPGGSDIPRVIYCDAIHNNGVASGSVKNFISGNADVRRCNISGYIDVFAVKTANDNTGHTTIGMDNFIHDLRLVDDPGQPGRSHNDSYQTNQTGATAELTHNTIFGSATNNFSAVESWTRASGPHWTPGATPYDCVFENPSTGGDEVGRINAGACQLQSGAGATFIFTRNLVAGSMFRVTNATTGNTCDVIDNEVAVAHMDSGNAPFGGTLRTVSGNRDWQSGAPIT